MDNRVTKPTYEALMTSDPEKNYFKAYIDYYVGKGDSFATAANSMKMLYKIAQGHIDEAEYKYVLNPTNTNDENLTRAPARFRNYDIIGPVLDLFMGDFILRPNDATVFYNGGEDSIYKRKRETFISNYLAQKFINELNSAGVDTKMETVQQPELNEALEEFTVGYKNLRTGVGTRALEYIKANLGIDEKLQLLFYDWLVTGTVATYKSIYNDDVEWTPCCPYNVIPFGLNVDGYYEDAEAVLYIDAKTLPELIDRWQLTPEEVKSLQSENGSRYDAMQIGISGDTTVDFRYRRREVMYDTSHRYTENIVNWKGETLVGTLTYTHPITGTVEVKEVDYNYNFEPELGDISIEWHLKEVAYLGVRIGKNIYREIGEQIVQRSKFNGTGVKLAFNGRYKGYRVEEIDSIVIKGLPYQILHNIFHFRYEMLIAAARDKLVAFPYGLIPDKNGMNTHKWFYWINIHKIMFYDESKPGAASAVQGIKEIDMSFRNSIDGLINVIERVRYEFWESIGMTRQRFGETTSSDGKAVNEQAINRSSVISLQMFLQFDRFLQKEYQGFLDWSKYAWREGKKATFLSGEGREMILDIEGDQFASSEYGVFCKNTAGDRETINSIRQAAIQMAASGGIKIDGIAALMTSKDLGTLQEITKDFVQKERDFQLQLQEQQNRAMLEGEKIKKEVAQLASEDKRYQADMTYLAYVNSAGIKAGVDLQSLVQDTMNMVDKYGGLALNNTDDPALRKAHEDMIASDLATLKEKQALEREKQKVALQIARENKNKYDK